MHSVTTGQTYRYSLVWGVMCTCKCGDHYRLYVHDATVVANIHAFVHVHTHTHRFNCGCWFARSEDDGSIERFLVAEKIPQTIAKSGTMSALGEGHLQYLHYVHAMFTPNNAVKRNCVLKCMCICLFMNYSVDVDSVLPSSPSRRRANKRQSEESELKNLISGLRNTCNSMCTCIITCTYFCLKN